MKAMCPVGLVFAGALCYRQLLGTVDASLQPPVPSGNEPYSCSSEICATRSSVYFTSQPSLGWINTSTQAGKSLLLQAAPSNQQFRSYALPTTPPNGVQGTFKQLCLAISDIGCHYGCTLFDISGLCKGICQALLNIAYENGYCGEQPPSTTPALSPSGSSASGQCFPRRGKAAPEGWQEKASLSGKHWAGGIDSRRLWACVIQTHHISSHIARAKALGIFIELTLEDNSKLWATPGHYIPVQGDPP